MLDVFAQQVVDVVDVFHATVPPLLGYILPKEGYPLTDISPNVNLGHHGQCWPGFGLSLTAKGSHPRQGRGCARMGTFRFGGGGCPF